MGLTGRLEVAANSAVDGISPDDTIAPTAICCHLVAVVAVRAVV